MDESTFERLVQSGVKKKKRRRKECEGGSEEESKWWVDQAVQLKERSMRAGLEDGRPQDCRAKSQFEQYDG